MTAKEFFDLVAEMRKYQKDFFSTKSSEALKNSVRIEKLVDDEIKRVQKVLSDKQMNLFDL